MSRYVQESVAKSGRLTHQNGIGVLAGLQSVIRQRLSSRVNGATTKVVRLEADLERGALLGNELENASSLLDDLGADTVTGEDNDVVSLLAHLCLCVCDV